MVPIVPQGEITGEGAARILGLPIGVVAAYTPLLFVDTSRFDRWPVWAQFASVTICSCGAYLLWSGLVGWVATLLERRAERATHV